MSKELIESYDEFKYLKMHESDEPMPSYDEQDEPPKASIRQEDWQSNDILKKSAYILEEIIHYIEDGEELDKSQQKLIKNMFKLINTLKLQLEEREHIRQKELEDIENLK